MSGHVDNGGEVFAGGGGGTPAAGSVTLAMQADLATDKIIGRVSSGTGVPEAVTFTDAAQALCDDADAAAQRVTLGLGGPAELAFVDIPVGGYTTCDGALMVSGGLRFDPADFARAGKTTVLTLRFLGDVSAAITGTVAFYNLTAAAAAMTPLSVTSTTAGNHQTGVVTTPGVASSYEARLSHGGTDTQYFTQRAAVLRVTWS